MDAHREKPLFPEGLDRTGGKLVAAALRSPLILRRNDATEVPTTVHTTPPPKRGNTDDG